MAPIVVVVNSTEHYAPTTGAMNEAPTTVVLLY